MIVRSKAWYLSKILRAREELTFDRSYGAFLDPLPPVNLIQLPFIPFVLLFRKGDFKIVKINMILMKMQYFIIMSVFLLFFIFISLSLVPFAWMLRIYEKTVSDTPEKEKRKEVALYVVTGLPILVLFTCFDAFYFFKNSFRTDLD